MNTRLPKNDPALDALLNIPGPLNAGQIRSSKFDIHDQIALRTVGMATRRLDGLPVRDVANGRRNRPIGEYISYKAGIRLPHESSHEKLGHYLNEVDPEIFHTLAQPHTLHFISGGEQCRYTPDIELWTERGHFVREIKEASELRSDPALRRKLHIVEEIYQRAGFCFQVLTDKDIRTEPRLHNATLVQRFRRLRVLPETEARLIDHLEMKNGVSTLDDCAKSLKLADGGPELVMTFMCRRLLRIDFAKPITGQSAVFRHYSQEPAQPSIAIRRSKCTLTRIS